MAAGLPVVLQDGTNTYVYGLDLISTTDNAGAQTYHLYDGLGSTTGLVDGRGNGVASYGYDVFGAMRTQGGSSANHWLFTGEQRDSESDVYYLRARYYDPTTGRFLTQDPLPGWAGAPKTQNRYAYVLNNPVRYTDPFGLMSHRGTSPCQNVAPEARRSGMRLAGALLVIAADAPEVLIIIAALVTTALQPELAPLMWKAAELYGFTVALPATVAGVALWTLAQEEEAGAPTSGPPECPVGLSSPAGATPSTG